MLKSLKSFKWLKAWPFGQLEVGGALALRLEAKPKTGIMEWWNDGKAMAHSSKLKAQSVKELISRLVN